MKIISWNVNGIRAAAKKGLADFIKSQNADIYCFQEVRATKEQLPEELKNLKGYRLFLNPAQRPGWSGVAVYSGKKPRKVFYKIGDAKIDKEGRVVFLEFDKFYLICAYFVQAGRELLKLDDKLKFNKKFEKYCLKLSRQGRGKPIVIAGDFNVAHKEIDLANPKENKGNAMFTAQERGWLDRFLKKGFLDAFRVFNHAGGNYTWWTWRSSARARNIGWRIDYFLISRGLKNKLKSSKILKDIKGSDHCPISLEIMF